jgi:hypothetical protein
MLFKAAMPQNPTVNSNKNFMKKSLFSNQQTICRTRKPVNDVKTKISVVVEGSAEYFNSKFS